MTRPIRFFSVFMAILLAFGAAGTALPAIAAPVVISTANFTGSSIDQANKQQITDVFNGINTFRKSKGLKPVRFNVTVTEMAEDWSARMASDAKSNQANSFRHNPKAFTDSRVANRWNAAGEIIAARSDTSGQGLVDQWIASPGHNAIMSSASYTEIGIGIAKNKGGFTMYGTVDFYSWFSDKTPSGSYASPSAYFNAVSVKTVSSTKPTFNAAKNTVTIPKKTGVTYYLNGTKKAAGTYTQTGTGTVSAKASSGSYKISGSSSWKFDNRNAVSPTKPTFNVSKNTVTIPKKTGVTYYLNGTKKAAGTYTQKGTGTVTAKASSGSYKISGTSSWKYNNGK